MGWGSNTSPCREGCKTGPLSSPWPSPQRQSYDVAGDSAREMGGLSLAEALSLCELLAKADPARYERAALRWLERLIAERLPPVAEVALAASALAELSARPPKHRCRDAEAVA